MTKKQVKALFVQGLYASNVDLTENGRIPSTEELEEFAEAVIYVPFGGLLPFGFWRQRGYSFEYPALIPTPTTDLRLRRVETDGAWIRRGPKTVAC
jgi:hypothetical protein